jgi:hypothetical protein
MNEFMTALPRGHRGSDENAATERVVAAVTKKLRKAMDFAEPLHQRRAVRFSPTDPELISAPSPLDAVIEQNENSDAWKSDLWFSVADLTQMRGVARDMCRQMRANYSQVSAQTSTTLPNKQPQKCVDSDSRGLEQRSCMERQRRKYVAMRFILSASQKLRQDDGEERLAAVAVRCNSWATELAIEEAARDFGRAYGNSCDDILSQQAPPRERQQPYKRLSSDSDTLEQATRHVRAKFSPLGTNC